MTPQRTGHYLSALGHQMIPRHLQEWAYDPGVAKNTHPEFYGKTFNYADQRMNDYVRERNSTSISKYHSKDVTVEPAPLI